MIEMKLYVVSSFWGSCVPITASLDRKQNLMYTKQDLRTSEKIESKEVWSDLEPN